MKINILKLFTFSLILFQSLSVNAIELVCNGRSPNLRNQRPVFVNCGDRGKVLSALYEASQMAKGNPYQSYCTDGYTRVSKLDTRWNETTVVYMAEVTTSLNTCSTALSSVP